MGIVGVLLVIYLPKPNGPVDPTTPPVSTTLPTTSASSTTIEIPTTAEPSELEQNVNAAVRLAEEAEQKANKADQLARQAEIRAKSKATPDCGPIKWSRGEDAGFTYYGEKKNGTVHGYGVFYRRHVGKDNYTYSGMFEDGLLQGHGIRTDEECVYAGEIYRADRTGYGVKSLFKDGTVQKGRFIKGKLNGYGAEYNADGSLKRHGLWENGKLIEKVK